MQPSTEVLDFMPHKSPGQTFCTAAMALRLRFAHLAGARGPLVAEEERVLKLRQEREQEVQRELEVGAQQGPRSRACCVLKPSRAGGACGAAVISRHAACSTAAAMQGARIGLHAPGLRASHSRPC